MSIAGASECIACASIVTPRARAYSIAAVKAGGGASVCSCAAVAPAPAATSRCRTNASTRGGGSSFGIAGRERNRHQRRDPFGIRDRHQNSAPMRGRHRRETSSTLTAPSDLLIASNQRTAGSRRWLLQLIASISMADFVPMYQRYSRCPDGFLAVAVSCRPLVTGWNYRHFVARSGPPGWRLPSALKPAERDGRGMRG